MAFFGRCFPNGRSGCFSGNIFLLSPEYINNNAEIRRVKQRIAYLESLASRQTAQQVIDGIRLVENVEANGMQLFFDDIPSEEVRKKLKSNGFKWSPSIGAWQRHLNPGAARIGRELLEKL